MFRICIYVNNWFPKLVSGWSVYNKTLEISIWSVIDMKKRFTHVFVVCTPQRSQSAYTGSSRLHLSHLPPRSRHPRSGPYPNHPELESVSEMQVNKLILIHSKNSI